MKLTIFQSDKGDCFLLEDKKEEHRVLCDGGMKSSMEEWVRKELAKLRTAKKEVDFIYISHIDNDHITGVLQLLQDEVQWRVYDHHKDSDDPVKEPSVPRPPVFKGILHNAFHDQIGKNTGEIEDLLAAAVPTLFATNIPSLMQTGVELEGIATAVKEAIIVSRLAKADALNIPTNNPQGDNQPAKLLVAGQPNEQFKVGTMKFTLIGPTDEELENLRDGWQTWLRNNKPEVNKIRSKLKKQIDDFSTGTFTGSPFDLGDWNGVPAYDNVTPPNIASLMYIVEEDGKTLLLTGDAHQDHILAGLERAKYVKAGEGLHLDVLKVQHHGSNHNLKEQFARRISATHYVFGANGSDGNPDNEVLDLIFDSRFGNDPDALALAAPDNEKVHFWFSTSSELVASAGAKIRFKAIEAKVKGMRDDVGANRLELHFNDGASIDLEI